MLKQEGFLHELKKNKVLFLMVAPTILFFMLNSYAPMIGIYYAFTRFEFSGGLFGSPFVGLQNFKFLFESGTLLNITVNTVLYNLTFIIAGNLLQIIIAILLSEIASKWFRKLSQSVILLPYFVSFVLLSVLAYNFMNYEHGFVNNVLKSIGLGPFDFYNSPGVWKYLITGAYIWKTLGYGSVIYLATIVNIGQEFYEASQIDGANIFQQIWYITLPMIKPTFITLFLFALGSIMKGQFDLFYQMVGSNGILYDATDIIDTYVFRSLMQNFDIGMGTAAGLYQSMFGFLVIVSVNFIIKRKNAEYALF